MGVGSKEILLSLLAVSIQKQLISLTSSLALYHYQMLSYSHHSGLSLEYNKRLDPQERKWETASRNKELGRVREVQQNEN